MGIWSPAAESAARRWWGWGTGPADREARKIPAYPTKNSRGYRPAKIPGLRRDPVSTIRKTTVCGIVKELKRKPPKLGIYWL